MNEGQIYRAECIRKSIDDMEVFINKLGLSKEENEVIMKNVEIIKHHSLSLIVKKDEWE